MIMIRCYALHITSVNTTLLAPFTTSVGPFNLFDQNDTSPIRIIGVYCPLVAIIGHWRGPGPNVQHGKQQYSIYTHSQLILQMEAVTVNVFCFQTFPVTSDPDIKDFNTWSAAVKNSQKCVSL